MPAAGGPGVGYAQGVRKALVVACASALGLVWACRSFDTAVDGAGSPDATTGDAGPDAPVVLTDARAPRGPRCADVAKFCNAGELCCFRISGAADTCVTSAKDCQADPEAGTGAFVLACSDSASCPTASPNCCFTFGAGQGSSCSARPCATPLQLCAGDDDCMAPAHCTKPTSMIDDYYGECH